MLALVILTAPLIAEAQQQQRPADRIAHHQPPCFRVDEPRGIPPRLASACHVEGQNIIMEYRYADGNSGPIAQFAAELVRLNVAVIVTTGSPPTRAAQQATQSIPIVMTAVGDPIEAGFVASSLHSRGETLTIQ